VSCSIPNCIACRAEEPEPHSYMRDIVQVQKEAWERIAREERELCTKGARRVKTLRPNPLEQAARIMYPAQCPECKRRAKTKAEILHDWPCVPCISRRRLGDG
jgi:hypothetical protein